MLVLGGQSHAVFSRYKTLEFEGEKTTMVLTVERYVRPTVAVARPGGTREGIAQNASMAHGFVRVTPNLRTGSAFATGTVISRYSVPG